jgi:hypothetical protein
VPVEEPVEELGEHGPVMFASPDGGGQWFRLHVVGSW